MPPSSERLGNLSRMDTILNGNWRAQLLARSLWEFYHSRIYCTIRGNDLKPNRIRLIGVLGPKQIGDVGFCISIRHDERQEEALVHELLHANLIPLGYRRFWINDDSESEEYRRAAGIINLADHKLMRPIFLGFGYSENRFVGPGRELNDLELRIDKYFEAVRNDLQEPAQYLHYVGKCLSDHGVSFESMDIAAAMVSQLASR
jgi:hypothetical protein